MTSGRRACGAPARQVANRRVWGAPEPSVRAAASEGGSGGADDGRLRSVGGQDRHAGRPPALAGAGSLGAFHPRGGRAHRAPAAHAVRLRLGSGKRFGTQESTGGLSMRSACKEAQCGARRCGRTPARSHPNVAVNARGRRRAEGASSAVGEGGRRRAQGRSGGQPPDGVAPGGAGHHGNDGEPHARGADVERKQPTMPASATRQTGGRARPAASACAQRRRRRDGCLRRKDAGDVGAALLGEAKAPATRMARLRDDPMAFRRTSARRRAAPCTRGRSAARPPCGRMVRHHHHGGGRAAAMREPRGIIMTTLTHERRTS